MISCVTKTQERRLTEQCSKLKLVCAVKTGNPVISVLSDANGESTAASVGGSRYNRTEKRLFEIRRPASGNNTKVFS
jgi:hypothetical protein